MAAMAVPPQAEVSTGVTEVPVLVATATATATATPQTEAASVPEATTGEISNSSLYVGDLDPSVDESQLINLFNQVAPVVSIRVCRDQVNHSSLGYAYVNFSTTHDAANAKEMLNFTLLNGIPVRIMFCQRDPTTRKSGYANVFVKNLDSSIDNKALHDTFAAFGTILSCKLVVDSNGQSKGYGFVQFDQDEAAQNAINRLNGMLINDKQVHVALFVRRQDRNGSSQFTNVYVKNLPKSTIDEDLKIIFGKYGSITSAVVMKDANGKSKCFGFVNFEKPDSATAAVENLNGTLLTDKVLYVGKAQRKAEREAELKARLEQERVDNHEKLQGAKLYIKNLDDSITDEKLKELFSQFGTITSCKVMVDTHGISMGAGFVAFSTPEEATRALNEMKGKMIGRKPLYVAIAQRKEERRALLQAYFAQLRAPTPMASLPARMHGFHAGPPRLASPQMYFGQGSHGLLPPQAAGFGFQPHLLPGLHQGIGPNFLMPYHIQRQGQSGQRFGARRGGYPQQQWMQRNPIQGLSRYIVSGIGTDPSIVPQSLNGAMVAMPFAVSGMPVPPLERLSDPMNMSTLASAMASASPENQRTILGEHLFRLVESVERENAGKVTGMLLDMNQAQVLHLIESRDALKKQVAEALNVLRLASSDSDVGDRLVSLPSNEPSV